jgi:hypothetical protein
MDQSGVWKKFKALKKYEEFVGTAEKCHYYST